ncbi:hypothetical protein OnM2_017056, partial [Erysiphe neolycopersici]
PVSSSHSDIDLILNKKYLWTDNWARITISWVYDTWIYMRINSLALSPEIHQFFCLIKQGSEYHKTQFKEYDFLILHRSKVGISQSYRQQHKGGSQLGFRQRIPPIPSGTLIEIDDNQIEDSVLVSKKNVDNGKYKDVNAFETNNAAEWDEEPVSRGKRLDQNDMSVFEEKAEKVSKIFSV